MSLQKGGHPTTHINQCSWCGARCKEDEDIREIFMTSSLVWSPILEKMKVDRTFALHLPDWHWGDRHCPIAVGIYCTVGQHIEVGFAACSALCGTSLQAAIYVHVNEVDDIIPGFLSSLVKLECKEWKQP